MNVKGFLKLNVLHELMLHDMSGYALIKKISEIQDKKPSPGSIYPLLNQLLSDGYVSVKSEGRKKIYSISSKGRRRVDTLIEEKEKMMDRHVKMMHSFGDIVGKPGVEEVERIFSQIRATRSIPQNMDLFVKLAKRLIQLKSDKCYPQKQKAIRVILKNTLDELNKLK